MNSPKSQQRNHALNREHCRALSRAYYRGYDDAKAGYRGPNPYYPAPHVPMTSEEKRLADAYDVGQDAYHVEVACARDDAFSRSQGEQ